MTHNPIIVALDIDSPAEALDLVRRIDRAFHAGGVGHHDLRKGVTLILVRHETRRNDFEQVHDSVEHKREDPEGEEHALDGP